MDIGDKVIFKTGQGPIMVIIKPFGPAAEGEKAKGRVFCRWWSEKNGRFEQRYFGTEELELYEEAV